MLVLGVCDISEQVVELLRAGGWITRAADSVGEPARDAGEPPTAIVLLGGETAPSRTRRLAEAREHAPGSPVVLVCDSVDSREVRDALAAGVLGIVLAADVAAALCPCVTAAHVGQVCVPAGNRRALAPPVLSQREKQILGLVVMGHTNAQIAEQLFLAESTVKSHLSSAFVKLGVHSRYEAVDLILDPARGLALGILALGCEPLDRELVASA